MLRLSLRGPWLYVSGTTARYRHRLGETRGEAASLGHVHEDRRRTRAEVLDAFGATVARERPALVAEIRGLAGRQWANAGRHLQARGRGPEAIDCFDRAVAARAFDLRSRWARRRSARSTAG